MTPVAGFFFYGTLCDAEVRARVLGAAAAGLELVPAVAPGWRAVYACGRAYPVLVPGRGDAAPGVLARSLDRDGVRRLIAYEGAGYRVSRVTVRLADDSRVAAGVFLPRRRLRPGARRFDLAAWQRAQRARYLKRFA